jgi:hypothetical protein
MAAPQTALLSDSAGTSKKVSSGYKLGPLDPLRGLKCKYSKNSKKSNITLLDLLLLSLNSS